jgi:hypothetical protein
VQADSNHIHVPTAGSRNPRLSRPEETTIYGRQFLAVAIDEAHAYRNPNKAYTAMRALREKTDLLVAMTATPVQTRPAVRNFVSANGQCLIVMHTQDLWYIGKVVGLPGFKDDKLINEELTEMRRDLARAKRDDKRILSNHSAESRSALHRVFHGKNDEGTLSAVNKNVDQNYHQANARWMKTVREKYQGAVIRRTGNSLDVDGQAISGLDPYEEHICMLKLFTHEYEALETLAEQALDTETFARRFSSEVSNAYFVTGRPPPQLTKHRRST